MTLYKREIEELESHLSAIAPAAGMNPQSESIDQVCTCVGIENFGCFRQCNDLFIFHVLHRIRTPHTDIIDILQLQYKPFLILAAQLQTTHEHVQVRLNVHVGLHQSYLYVYMHNYIDSLYRPNFVPR